ncbi:acyltransferase [Pengzhenrongella frigida]|uniref:Acyltransferase n=1 Tax=Pengzhenrongella frigida TaxID=1259133 RepID=A0A4Q5N479_9MICO|nr:acyltransferase [Cellulomonas sp. HLT2-17]RYV52103.1 acyltransferase [Cellulomonas sp. HLT2-17]
MTPADDDLRADFAPWEYWQTASPEQRADQGDRIAELRGRGLTIGTDCVVSRLAAVHPEALVLGDRSSVAAHAHLTGDVVLGADCSVNVAAAVRGRVRIGRAVRIGAHTSVLGFEHGFADLEREIFRQPLSSTGITIGDDVWLGSHVVVLDGVRIGSHAVVGAGSVVTKSVPEWAVVVGNPARVVRDRRTSAPGTAGTAGTARTAGAAGGPDALTDRLRGFAQRATAELPQILAAAWVDGLYRDAPSAPATVRAHGDAVELADLLLGGPPAQLTRAEHVARLRALQDPVSGLVAERGGAGEPVPDAEPASSAKPQLPDQSRAYHVLSVGYALDLLGSSFEHPVRAVTVLSPGELVGLLDGLPWRTNAWGAGALVDSVGTALTWARLGGHPTPAGLVDTLVGWLTTHREPASGLWGSAAGELLEPVNGTYRAVRGTLAQWGVPVGGQDRLIDTVLERADQIGRASGTTACDALDVVHLLWWAASTGPEHRRAEIDAVPSAVLARALSAWVPGRGVPFAPGREPSLQGTEMWLAVVWYAADLLGCADALGYRPRGVHRPEPALSL